jgi:hypothetical protein
MTDAHNLLLRALGQRIGSAHDLVLRESRLESWASATFQGMRHRYSLGVVGPEAWDCANRLADALDAIEFDLPGHLVADINAVERSTGPGGTAIVIEALTLEDA